WTTTHGFFVLMGGFYHFVGDEPHNQASRKDVKTMISTGSFEPPDILAIKGRSKSDAFSKIVTIMQTLWFVVQCIARIIQHLPITNIEIATLAYTTISFALYHFWLKKPLNVSFPIRLEQIGRPESQRSGSPRVAGTVELWPWGQDAEKLNKLQDRFANAVTLAVGAIFGAVHCIAWSFAFPSPAEKLLWRISAATTVVIPFFIPFFHVVSVALKATEVNLLIKRTFSNLFAVISSLYLVARAILLVLTFTTLRDLPPAAYESIHWMSFIPHV
ncbi:hypothetical protein FIBSPDRAFT_660738, partial [Athelia psychrophila]